MLSEPPLVGRDEEIGRLGSILKRVTSGSGGLILLSGEAGIGKTRLATEFERQAQASGCKVLVGGCLPSSHIPYLVFLEALNELFEGAAEKKATRSSRLVGAGKKAAPELLKAVPLFGGVLKSSAAFLSESVEGQKAMRDSFLAGEFCLKNHALHEAIPNCERALTLGTSAPGFEEYRLQTIEGLGDAYESGGEVISASKHYQDLLSSGISGKQKVRVLRKLAYCWAPMRLGKGSKDKSLEYIAQAQAMPEIDAVEEAQIFSLLKGIASSEGNWAESERYGLASEERLRTAKNMEGLCIQLIYNSPVYITLYDVETAFEKLKEAEGINQVLQDMDMKMEWNLHSAWVYMHMGNMEETRQHLDACGEIAKKLGIDSILSIVNFYLSMVSSLVMDFETAVTYGDRGRDIAEKISRDFLKLGADAALAHAYFGLGKGKECKEYASEALKTFDGFERKINGVNIGMTMLAGAEAANVEGDWAEAQKYYLKAIDVFESSIMGKLMLGMTRVWYADALNSHEKTSEAKEQLLAAESIFKKLGNQDQLRSCLDKLKTIS